MENNDTIGTFIQYKREQKKFTIEEVAQKTKINLNILRHLEADELDKLPNKTYVKGFVKSVGKLLGFNQDEALLILENTYSPPIEEPEQSAQEDIKEDLTQTNIQSSNLLDTDFEKSIKSSQKNELQEKVVLIAHCILNKKVITSTLAVLILIIILKGVFSFFTQLSNEGEKISNNTEQSEVLDKNNNLDKLTDNTDSSIDGIKGKDQNLFELKATKQLKQLKTKESAPKDKVQNKTPPQIKSSTKISPEISKENITNTKADTKLDTTEEKPKVKEEVVKKNLDLNGKFPLKKFYPAPADMYDIQTDAKENQDEQLLPSRFKQAVESGKENVFIHATSGDTWISYVSDDNEIKRFVLKKGRSVLIKGKVILLFMGNINVAHIFYNNQLIKAYSKTGVKSLIFPESQAKNYELPLFPSHNGVLYKSSDYKANMITN